MSGNTDTRVRVIEERDRAQVNALFSESIHDLPGPAVDPLSNYAAGRWPLDTYVALDESDRLVGALHGQVLPDYFQLLSNRYGAPAENYLRKRVRHITQLAVAQAYRGQGIGSRLMETALGQMRADGVRHVAGFVQDADAAALGFYRRHGFEITPTAPPVAPHYPEPFQVARPGQWFYQHLARPSISTSAGHQANSPK